jgi:lipopolysaccharide export system protein LptA
MLPDARARRGLLACCALLFLALAAPGAHAERGDRNKPISYSADTGEVNTQTKAGSLVGHVVLTQGTLTIEADRVNFHQNPDDSLSAVAYGNPVKFRQKRDDVDEWYEGFAQRGEYDGSKDLLQLYDRALLRRGGDEIRSNYISYNTATDIFKAEGRPDASAEPGGPGPRVRGVFQPKSEPGKAGADKGAAKAPAATVPLKPATDVAPGPVK